VRRLKRQASDVSAEVSIVLGGKMLSICVNLFKYNIYVLLKVQKPVGYKRTIIPHHVSG
jgi:hypothetical protein